MKIISVIGNSGKTSTSEILYSYLANKGYKVIVSNSSGMFSSDNYFSRKLPLGFISNTRYHEILDLKNFYDYLIVEMHEETAYKDFLEINHEKFDAVINCSYNEDLMNLHLQTHDDFGFKYIRDLNYSDFVLVSEDNMKYFPEDIQLKLKSYKQLNIISSSFESMQLQDDKNTIYTTSLISAYHARNLSAAKATLEYLNEFDINVFNQTISNIYIRGRFDKMIKDDKKIIIDTGWNGIDLTLDELSTNNIINLNSTLVIFVPYLSTETDTEKQWRINVANYLKNNNIPLILTSKNENLLEDFNKYYVEATQFNNFVWLQKYNEALNEALLRDKQFIYIASNDRFRDIKNTLEEIINKEKEA